MKIISGVIVLLLFNPGVILAGKNADATVSIQINSYVVRENGVVGIPVVVSNIGNAKGMQTTLSFVGECNSVIFEPTDYFHNAICIEPIIDKWGKTITIAVAATERIVTKTKSGIIGYLYFDDYVQVEDIKIVETCIVDDEYNVDTYTNEEMDTTEKKEQKEIIIKKNLLYDNYPNPANPHTVIPFDMNMIGDVRLDIYNVKGELVRTLVNEILKPEHYEYSWDGRDSTGRTVSSGIYFYRLKAGTYTATKKLLLMK